MQKAMEFIQDILEEEIMISSPIEDVMENRRMPKVKICGGRIPDNID
jgi:hypothetical protein